MAASYSQDFREKVIAYVKKGNSYKAAAEKFDISENTSANWYRRYKIEGHYLERIRLGKKGKINRKDFEEYVLSKPNTTLFQIGKHYAISIRTASYYMKKFGFSYKKKPLAMWKRSRS